MTSHEAACSCGQLRLICQGDPVRVSMCHCFECQRRTGSTFGVQAWFPLERSPSELNRGRDSRIGFDLLEDRRRGKEAAGMALSDDLRERVVGAVVEGGMSRNAAAKRFG